MTPVKDQGSCGSCWAFAAAGGAESVIRIQNNTIYDLSEEYLLECTGSRDDCSGGYMSDVMPLLFRTGKIQIIQVSPPRAYTPTKA